MNLDKEIWKLVPGFPYYEASTFGNIRNIKTKKYRKFYKVKAGYLNVTLHRINDKSKTFGVHIIIANTFLDNPSNKKTVNHRNHIRDDNNLSNLHWATMAEQNNLKKPLSGKKKTFPIWKCDPITGEKIERFDNALLASEQIGKKPQNIYACALGKINKCYGFKWKYEEKEILDNEVWKSLKDIVNNGDGYYLSNYGRVRNMLNNLYLPCKNANGYMLTTIKEKGYYTHILLANLFLEKKDSNKNIVNHIDGNKENYDLTNLEWVTSSENALHAFSSGLRIYKGKVVNQYDLQNNFIQTHISLTEASKSSGVKAGLISAAVNKKQKTAGKFIWKLG